MLYAVCAVAGYFIGNIQPSILLSTKLKKADVREYGSGNAGATNMLRTFGWGMGILTFALDVLKGVLGYWIGYWIAGDIGAVTAGAGVVLGHDFPALYKFKGGKGIASTMGLMLAIDYRVAIVIFIGGALIVALTRYVSAGSLLLLIMFLLYALFFLSVPVKIMAFVVAVVGCVRHRGNIQRLAKGEEPTLSSKSKLK